MCLKYSFGQNLYHVVFYLSFLLVYENFYLTETIESHVVLLPGTTTVTVHVPTIPEQFFGAETVNVSFVGKPVHEAYHDSYTRPSCYEKLSSSERCVTSQFNLLKRDLGLCLMPCLQLFKLLQITHFKNKLDCLQPGSSGIKRKLMVETDIYKTSKRNQSLLR